jgi:Poly-beta-hydroxybutyrate polymerase (PhaC) N-terminus
MKVMDPIQLSLSLAGIAVRSQRLMVDFLTRHHELGGLGDPAGIGRAFLDLTAKMIADPMSIAQTQLELWKEHVKLLQRTTERLFDITGRSEHPPVATDRRFQHPAWTENLLFDYIKQSYLISAEAILSAVNRVDGLNPKTAHKADFYTSQFVAHCAVFLCVARGTSGVVRRVLWGPFPFPHRMLRLILVLKERLLDLSVNADEPFFCTSGTVPKIIRVCLKFACFFFGRPQL